MTTVGRGLGVLLRTILSFEALFALFLYSNSLKILLPPFPVDETLLFLALSLPGAFLILWREGVPTRGIVVFGIGLLFFGWLTVGLLWTPSRGQALRTLGYSLVFNLYALAVSCLILAVHRQRLHRFLFMVTLIGLVLAGCGLWIWATHGSFRFYTSFAERRVYLAWGYPAATAAAIVVATALALPLASLRQLLALALAGTLAFFLLIATGRGPLLALAASIAVPLIAFAPVVANHRLHVPRVQLIPLAILLAGTLYIGHLIVTGQLNNTLGRFLSLYNDMKGDGFYERFSRLNYWRQSLVYWAQAPWLGHGPSSFAFLYTGRESAGTHPHNIFLEIAVDHGLVGLVLFGALLIGAASGLSLDRLRRDADYLCVGMALAGIMTGAMVSINLAAQTPLFVFIGLLTLRPGRPNGSRERGRPTE